METNELKGIPGQESPNFFTMKKQVNALVILTKRSVQKVLNKKSAQKEHRLFSKEFFIYFLHNSTEF